jgi:hypothetical protein
MINRTEYQYSPVPINSSSITLFGAHNVSLIIPPERETAIWNLYWLSLKDGEPAPNQKVLQAIILDVTEDEVLFRKLCMSPTQFLRWFRREDHSIYDTYYLLGGDYWAANVISRAEEAAARLSGQVGSNVVEVDFARRVA